MKLSLFAAAAVAGLLLGTAASAQDFAPEKAGTWVVDLRLTDVSPTGTNAITTAAGAPTGLNVHVSDDVVPTLGFTYLVTDHVSVEAILGTSYHQIKAEGPGTDVEVRDTWVLPPVVTVQYRFLPAARFDPYVGAGVNYMLFYNGSNKNGFTVKTPSGFGYALQAGADIAIKGPWVLNADVKKVYFETDASVDGGALKAKEHLDPWVLSLGLGRKF
jgi:outer membrane protein